ncbi:MAG: gamma-glutamyl-gamma-aminobutyrate hydrolase family protein [Bacteroidota bacterium]
MDRKALKIGIPARFIYPEPDRNPKLGPMTYTCVEQSMLNYLSRWGALPIMVPPGPEALVNGLLNEVDGLLLQGGSDIAPETYGADPIEDEEGTLDASRDNFELDMIGRALERDLPVLGICRGSQILNVFFGGTLYQDILLQHPGAIQHQDIPAYHRHFHDLDIVPGSLLADLHADEIGKQVNSVHHQGVQHLGEGLQPMAHCPEDGIVEAFIWEDSPEGSVMGIQWHPEFCTPRDGHLLAPERVLQHWLGRCGERT